MNKGTDPSTLTPEEIVQGYRRVPDWKPGVPRWGCNFCALDTMRLVVIQDHVIQIHQFDLINAQQAKTVPVESTLFDSNGKQITERDMTVRELHEKLAAQVSKYAR